MNSEMMSKLAELLNKEQAIVMTGAGISVESGIPDFRGPKGLWKRFSTDVFDISIFYEDPINSWRKYSKIYGLMKDARPNIAHKILAKLEDEGYVRAIITQNIDGLHQKAGSKEVIEIHGNAHRALCLKCGAKVNIMAPLKDAEKGKLPKHDCGGILKPDVVYFGEPLPPKELGKAIELSKTTKVFIVIGSSLTISPACDLPVIAKESGAKLVIANLEPTRFDYMADLILRGKASELMSSIARELELKI